jgi:hypothetical protein
VCSSWLILGRRMVSMSGLARVCSRKLDQAATDQRESRNEENDEKLPKEKRTIIKRKQRKGTAIWDSMISWANLKHVVFPRSSKSPSGRTEASASRGSPSRRTPKKSNVPGALENPAPEVLGVEISPKGLSLGVSVLGSKGVPWPSPSSREPPSDLEAEFSARVSGETAPSASAVSSPHV